MRNSPLNLKPTYQLKKKAAKVDSNKLSNTNAFKERLLQEMLELDAQKQQLEIGARSVDFSMKQTYKEMIQSRRMLLDQIDH